MRSRFIVVFILGILLISACNLVEIGGESTAIPTSEDNHTPLPTSPTGDGPGMETPTLEETTDSEPAPTETVSITPTATMVPTPTPHFVVQPGTPIGTVNIVKPDTSCNWIGIGGQVFGQDGVPVDGLIVEVGGSISGNEISQLAITGNAPILGPGGYLFELGDMPISSDGTVWLQLYSDGVPQSEKIFLTTYAECERNLLLVNFTESTAVQVRLPIIIK